MRHLLGLKIGHRFVAEESAATATEYAVMLALVLAVVIAGISMFGQNLNTRYADIKTSCFGG